LNFSCRVSTTCCNLSSCSTLTPSSPGVLVLLPLCNILSTARLPCTMVIV
jgi:hypothetical protein